VKHLIRNLDAEESARELEAAAAGMRVLIWCNSMSSAILTRDAAKKQGKLEYQVAAADAWLARRVEGRGMQRLRQFYAHF
jgi:hypothetical protein